MPRERMRDDESHDAPAPAFAAGNGDGTGGHGAELNRADHLLAAGDEAIRRALSANSEQFLQQNAQSGGQ